MSRKPATFIPQSKQIQIQTTEKTQKKPDTQHNKKSFGDEKQTIQNNLNFINNIINFAKRFRKAYSSEYNLCPKIFKELSTSKPEEDWETKENLVHSFLEKKSVSNYEDFNNLINGLAILATDYNDLPGFNHLSALLANATISLLEIQFPTFNLNIHRIIKLKLLWLQLSSYASFKLTEAQKECLIDCKNILFIIEIDQLDKKNLHILLTLGISLTYAAHDFYFSVEIDDAHFRKIIFDLWERIKQIKSQCDALSVDLPDEIHKNLKKLKALIEDSTGEDKIRNTFTNILKYCQNSNSLELKEKKKKYHKVAFDLSTDIIQHKNQLTPLPELMKSGLTLYLIYKEFEDYDACCAILQFLLSIYNKAYVAEANCITILFYASQHIQPKSHGIPFLLEAHQLLNQKQFPSEIIPVAIKINQALSDFYINQGQLDKAKSHQTESVEHAKVIQPIDLWLADCYFQNYRINYISYLQSQDPTAITAGSPFYVYFEQVKKTLKSSTELETLSNRITQYANDRKTLQRILIKKTHTTEIALNQEVEVEREKSSDFKLKSFSSSTSPSEIEFDSLPEIATKLKLKNIIKLFIQNQNRLFNLTKWKPYLSQINLDSKTIFEKVRMYCGWGDFIIAEFWNLLLLAKLCNQEPIRIIHVSDTLYHLSTIYADNRISNKIEKRFLLKCSLDACYLLKKPTKELLSLRFNILVDLATTYQNENWKIVSSYIPKIKDTIDQFSKSDTNELWQQLALISELATTWSQASGMSEIEDFRKWISIKLKPFNNPMSSTAIPPIKKVHLEKIQWPIQNTEAKNPEDKQMDKRINKIETKTEEKTDTCSPPSTEQSQKKKKKKLAKKLKKKILSPSQPNPSQPIDDLKHKMQDCKNQQIKLLPIETNKDKKEECEIKDCNLPSGIIRNKQEIDLDRKQLNQADEQNKHVIQQLKNTAEEKSKLQLKISKLEDQLNKSKEIEKKQISTIKNQKKGIDRIKKKLQKTDQQLNQQIAQLKEEKSNLQLEIYTLKAQLKESAETQERLNLKIHKQEKNIERVKKEQDNAQTLIQEFKAQQCISQKTIEILKTNLNCKTLESLRTKDDATKNNQMGKDCHLDLEAVGERKRLHSSQEKVKELETQLSKKESALAAKETVLAIQLEQNKKLEDELKKEKLNNRRLQTKLEREKRLSNTYSVRSEFYERQHKKATEIIQQNNPSPSYIQLNQTVYWNYPHFIPASTFLESSTDQVYSPQNSYYYVPQMPSSNLSSQSVPISSMPPTQTAHTLTQNYRSQRGYPGFSYSTYPEHQSPGLLTQPSVNEMGLPSKEYVIIYR